MGKRKKSRSYESGQYRGGRSGRSGNQIKNLTKVDGGVINASGVFISHNERKALESAVNRANKKRTKMWKEEAHIMRLFGGRPTGHTIGELRTMGQEGDFILSRKSKSLQQFGTRESFEIYMRNLNRVNNPNYLQIRARQYKANYLKALKDTFAWDDIKDVYMKIQMTPALEYMRSVDVDEAMEIGYLYEKESYYSKLNNIRAAAGRDMVEWDDEALYADYEIDRKPKKQKKKAKK